MKIQTINQLISVFKDIATRHYQINGFGIGDNWEIGVDKAYMHPVLWINPVAANMPESEMTGYKTFEIEFEVRVFDLVNKDESNENDVMSDCIDILKDIIIEFNKHPYYVNSQLTIMDDITFEPFTEEFDEEVTGWVADISMKTPVINSFCGLPMADITGFVFPGTDCPGVNSVCPVIIEEITGVAPIVVTSSGNTRQISFSGSSGDNFFITSGEYSGSTIVLNRNDGNSVDINGINDTFITSGEYSGSTIVLNRNDGNSVDITGITSDSIYTADGTVSDAERVVTLTGNKRITYLGGSVKIDADNSSGTFEFNKDSTKFLEINGSADLFRSNLKTFENSSNSNFFLNISNGTTLCDVGWFSTGVQRTHSIRTGSDQRAHFNTNGSGEFLVGNNLLVGSEDISLQGETLISKKLELSTTTDGFLMPRLTTTQKDAILSADTNLMLFDTDLNSFQRYDGSAWVNVSDDTFITGSTLSGTNLEVTRNDGVTITTDLSSLQPNYTADYIRGSKSLGSLTATYAAADQVIPMTVESENSNSSKFTLISDGVRVNQAGRYRINTSVSINSTTTARANPVLNVSVNGVKKTDANGQEYQSFEHYARNAGSSRTSTAQLDLILDLAEDDIVTVMLGVGGINSNAGVTVSSQGTFLEVVEVVASQGTIGFTGSFTNGDGDTVTVNNGIITNIA
jgi:hypothetical protein